MKKLIEKWRGRCTNHADECADELQAYIDSLWTEITDDPATWPKESLYVMVYIKTIVTERPSLGYITHSLAEGSTWYVTGSGYSVDGEYTPTHWRPLIEGIDTPCA